MAKLVGLYSSSAQSGKSEAAGIFVKDFNFVPMKFAGPLKNMARAFFIAAGLDRIEIERMVEGELKEAPVPGFPQLTPRRVMETLGTDWGREKLQPDIWIEVAKAGIEKNLNAGRDVVIDDLRFPNEYEAIKAMGGVTVRIIRPSARSLSNGRYEGQLDNMEFDYVIENGGSLRDLQNRAGTVAMDLLLK